MKVIINEPGKIRKELKISDEEFKSIIEYQKQDTHKVLYEFFNEMNIIPNTKWFDKLKEFYKKTGESLIEEIKKVI